MGSQIPLASTRRWGNWTIYCTESLDITKDQAKEFGKAWAKDGNEEYFDVAEIKVDEAQLKAINDAKHLWFVQGDKYTGLKVFNLTFTSPEGKTATIPVTLYSLASVIERDKNNISANDFTYDVIGGKISEDQSKKLAEAIWKDYFGNDLDWDKDCTQRASEVRELKLEKSYTTSAQWTNLPNGGGFL